MICLPDTFTVMLELLKEICLLGICTNGAVLHLPEQTPVVPRYSSSTCQELVTSAESKSVQWWSIFLSRGIVVKGVPNKHWVLKGLFPLPNEMGTETNEYHGVTAPPALGPMILLFALLSHFSEVKGIQIKNNGTRLYMHTLEGRRLTCKCCIIEW